MNNMGPMGELNLIRLLNHKTYISVFFCALIITLIVTPLVMRLAKRFGVLDRPTNRKIHLKTTPLMGGMAIFFGMWVSIAISLLFDNTITSALQKEMLRLITLLASGLVMLLVGIWDDKRGLSARWKFGFQFPLAIALVATGVRFETINLPLLGSIDLGSWSFLLSVLWIVGITNALNLVDGIDGLASGVAFFACMTCALISVYNENIILATTMFAMGGACLGFLRYNFSPARIFLGDTGSLFIGITLATSTASANSKGPLAASLLLPAMVMGYPMMDTLLAMARRKIRGKPVFSADRGHIHHRLLALGLCHRRAALVIYGICFLFSMLALALMLEKSGLVVFIIFLLSVILTVGLIKLGYLNFLKTQELNRERLLFRVANQFTAMQETKILLAENANQVLELLRQAGRELSMEGLEIRWNSQASNHPESELWWRDSLTGNLESRNLSPNLESTGTRGEQLVLADGAFVATLFYKINDPSNPEDLNMEYRVLMHNLIKIAQMRFSALDLLKPEQVSRPASSTYLQLPEALPDAPNQAKA